MHQSISDLIQEELNLLNTLFVMGSSVEQITIDFQGANLSIPKVPALDSELEGVLDIYPNPHCAENLFSKKILQEFPPLPWEEGVENAKGNARDAAMLHYIIGEIGFHPGDYLTEFLLGNKDPAFELAVCKLERTLKKGPGLNARELVGKAGERFGVLVGFTNGNIETYHQNIHASIQGYVIGKPENIRTAYISGIVAQSPPEKAELATNLRNLGFV